jgi:zinc and cadmium transporter
LNDASSSAFWWIFFGGVLMSAIAAVGSITLLLKEATLNRIVMPLVAFAAGSLLGGAFFHMLPAAFEQAPADPNVFLLTLIGFTVFFALEQFLHWHHCHRAGCDSKEPLTYLILLGDALHNFLGGLGVAGVFLIDLRLGITAWLAAAAHEVPQELGDFGVLIHGGWDRGGALLLNLVSGLTFLLGGMVAYAAAARIDVGFLVPFAAGNFIYIAASDLVPEVNKHREIGANLIHFTSFAAGIALLWAIRLAFAP